LPATLLKVLFVAWKLEELIIMEVEIKVDERPTYLSRTSLRNQVFEWTCSINEKAAVSCVLLVSKRFAAPTILISKAAAGVTPALDVADTAFFSSKMLRPWASSREHKRLAAKIPRFLRKIRIRLQ
jgi:hypothetical protein